MKSGSYLLSFVMGLAALVSAGHAQDSVEINGIVVTTNGAPIADATIFVHAAKPRDGARTVCAACFPDCQKTARSDDRGRFRFADMDPELRFRLLVTAAGYRPQFLSGIDPLGSAPRAALKPVMVSNAIPEKRIVGKVIDPLGRPVPAVMIGVEGVRSGTSTYFGGRRYDADESAVTDENGEFVLNCSARVESLTTLIEPQFLAKRRMWLEAGKAYLIRLHAGVNITGRLLGNDEPVSGVAIVMSTRERESSVYMSGFDTGTGDDGRFAFTNIPPGNTFVLYTKMKDMLEVGLVLPMKTVATGADGSTIDLGDLKLNPGYVLRGRVVMADGSPVSARSRLYLGLEEGSDSQDIRLYEDGAFEFGGIPAESIYLSLRVPGYRISARNPNKDWLNDGRIVGRLTKNHDDFIIHLEKGTRLEQSEMPAGRESQPSSKPLEGATL